MGFFSYNCSKTNKSIPAWPHAGMDHDFSCVVMITPDNQKIEGMYDGYGNIFDDEGISFNGKEYHSLDIYEVLAFYLCGKKDRDLIFDNVKRGYDANGVLQFELNKFNYQDPITKENILFAIDDKMESYLLGNNMNTVSEKYVFETMFDKAESMIKIVRADKYNGEKYDDLKVSDRCEYQGFFYDEEYIEENFKGIIQ